MSGNGSRVSIPNSVKKMIQSIKEITGNDSEEEIYVMLKECSMDPNETTQKLLLQDTFHEVKRKRDRRKEVTQNSNNKESAESRAKSGTRGWGSGGGRVNYLPRRASHDAGGGRNASGKENGVNHVLDKGVAPSLALSKEAKSKDTSSGRSSVTVMANGLTGISSGNAGIVHGPHSSEGSGVGQTEVSSSVDVSKLGSALPPNDVNKICSDLRGQPTTRSSNFKDSKTPPYLSAVCLSSSDPLPSKDIHLPSTSMIKCEVGQPTYEENAIAAENKLSSAASEIGISSIQGEASSKSQGAGKNQLTETSQPSSTSTHGSSSVSRPSSNYSNHSQQTSGPIKAGSNKEWKPKPTHTSVAAESGTDGVSEVPAIQVETSARSQPVSNAVDSEEATSKLQKKLEELHLPQRQHVILPNHIHVPESERTKLSFGSFGASFGVTMGYNNVLESDGSSTPLSETSEVIEAGEEHVLSNQDALKTTEEGDFPDHQQSPTHVHEILLSGDSDVSGNTVPEYSESKQDTVFLSEGHQYSAVHTSPNYSFGFAPPMLGNQPFENSESQARDGSHLPSFVVQQPFDPSSYYAQFYRPGADTEGRISPFAPTGAPPKYNRNATMLPPQSSQSPQEGANSLVLSTAGPTALVTQAAGLVQNSMAMTQQPVPVFGPPTGMHIPHYPPNYVPYGPYFSHPFYLPPPAIHQFLSNGAFPQPQASSVYPAPPAASATGVKYSFPPYKPGTNTGNTAHIGMPSGYGAYGSSPAGYNPSSASAAGNTNSNEDLGASQFKESNVYITGQQSEGSAVWIAAPGRDISGMPESSFYNLPQGQHMTYAPTQVTHGTFAGMYHPGQAVSAASVHPLLQQPQTMAVPVDMSGPAASVYHQPQHTQLNWPNY